MARQYSENRVCYITFIKQVGVRMRMNMTYSFMKSKIKEEGDTEGKEITGAGVQEI